MSDVFVSYSRKNSDFARKLIEHLYRANKDSWVDWEGIPLSAPNWWSEIKAGIDNSDSFVFIMSPDSMASVVCNLELDYAIELGKRIIPVMYQEIKSQDAFASIADYTPDEAMAERLEGKDHLVMARDNWQRVGHINWVFFRDDDDFDTAFDSLIEAVETDLEYVKSHTRYLTRAQEWERNNKRIDLLLFGEEIKAAESWLPKAETYTTEAQEKSEKEEVVNPLLLPIQGEYIEESRKQEQRRKTLARSAQGSIAVLALVLIGGAIIGFIALSGLNTQIDSANVQLAEATEALSAVNTQVADANNQLSAVPPTLTEVNSQVIVAQGQADEASTQVELANEQLATATQALGEVNTQVAVAFVTVTQAAIDQEIVEIFANTILQQSGNPAAQLAAMNDLVAQYPQEALAYQSRGIIYDEQDNYEAAIQDYDQAIALNPRYDITFYNRGNAYQNLEEYEAAIEDYDQAIVLNPQSPMFYNRGNAYFKLGDYEAAIEDYNQAIVLNPQDTDAFTSRGLAYANLGDYEAAIDDYEQAVALNPQLVEAYVNRGNAYAELGDYDAAIEDYEQAIALNLQDVDAFYNRGLAYANLGDYEAAISDYEQAIALNPQFADAFNNRGIAYRNLGNYETAVSDYTQAIALNPQDATAFYNRGIAYTNLGDYGAAIDDYEQAIIRNPQDAAAFYNRGLAYLQRGGFSDIEDLELALLDFSAAIELDNVQGYLLRGATHFFLENYDEALSDFDSYEALGGIFDDFSEGLRDEAERIVNEGE